MHMPKIYMDEWCEVFDILEDCIDGSFWEFDAIDIEPGAVYVLGRLEFDRCRDRVLDIVNTGRAHVIFSNVAEGSTTMIGNLQKWNHSSKHLCHDMALSGRLTMMSGGDMGPGYRHHVFEFFAYRLSQFEENVSAMPTINAIFADTVKPYKFLFLNGRSRFHRRHMLQRWQDSFLDQALWSNLDQGNGNLKFLPVRYEVDRYQKNIGTFDDVSGFVKFELFANETFDNNFFGKDNNMLKKSRMATGKEWGEVYIWPPCYRDTYFSLVSETVYKTDCSFRTEKIWKPIMIGHPWIAVANRGFYRDIRNLGFRTFDHVIDESFDELDHHERLDRVMQVVEDLCDQDLLAFLAACEDTCRYNQQRFMELAHHAGINYPQQFMDFVKSVTNE